MHAVSVAQTVTFPIDFEASAVVNSDFFNFNGGTATVIPNPFSSGLNTSPTVGQMVRNGGQPWAGAFLTTPANVDFSTDPYICMKVYTTAPIGTQVSFKMEGCGGACSHELNAYTTVSGAWETLCYDFSGQPTTFDRLVFLFDLGNVGNGSASSTFYFDDVQQLTDLPLTITPGSTYFCPDESLTLLFPGSGSYNWYSDPAGTILLQSNSATYTTPLLSASTSYYVRDLTPVPIPPTDLGPTLKGSTNPESGPASVFFTSNIDNGFWYSVDIVEKISGGGPPPYTCQYTVAGYNLTQGTSQSLTWNHVGAADNSQWTYVFPAPLPMDLDDNMELRVTVSGDVGCYISSHHAGGDVITSYPTASSGGELLFTSHTPVANNWMGFDYNVSGDFVDPTLYQVNAIADCIAVLPVELIQFSVEEYAGDALLTWTTASEINNSHFTILRSENGTEFLPMNTVLGVGNSSSLVIYSYRDESPLKGLSYYKLRQVDYDGTETESHAVPFSLKMTDGMQVFPNPFDETFTLSWGGIHGKVKKVLIHDLSGRTLLERDIVQEEQHFYEQFDLSHIPKGIYSIDVITKRSAHVLRIIKK